MNRGGKHKKNDRFNVFLAPSHIQLILTPTNASSTFFNFALLYQACPSCVISHFRSFGICWLCLHTRIKHSLTRGQGLLLLLCSEYKAAAQLLLNNDPFTIEARCCQTPCPGWRPWASYLASLSLNLLMCKMGAHSIQLLRQWRRWCVFLRVVLWRKQP